jgi:hypothetical protein
MRGKQPSSNRFRGAESIQTCAVEPKSRHDSSNKENPKIWQEHWKFDSDACLEIVIGCSVSQKKIPAGRPVWVLRRVSTELTRYANGGRHELVD